MRAIQSVLAQSYQDFEIVIVDDGQRERAEEVVKSIGDARIRYYPNATSLGGGATRNRGIGESHGLLIAFLDDDDEWLPEKLAIQVGALQTAPVDVGFSATAVINVFDTFERATAIEEGITDFSEIALRRFKGFLTSTLMVRRGVFEKTGGFDGSLPSHQEAELIIRITRHYRGVGISTPLTRMNMSSQHSHIGQDLNRRIKGKEMVMAKHEALFSVRPKLLAQHLYWLGLWYRDTGRSDDARKAFRRAWNVHHRLRYLFHYLSAVTKFI